MKILCKVHKEVNYTVELSHNEIFSLAYILKAGLNELQKQCFVGYDITNSDRYVMGNNIESALKVISQESGIKL